MSPAASSALPTRSEAESWDVSHLESAASRWSAAAEDGERLFGQHVRNLQSPGGTEWTGVAAEAAVERGEADLAVVRRQGDVLREASSIAATGAQDQRAQQRAVLDAISEAESDGFKVNDDLSVADTRKSDEHTQSARTTLAAEHADYIRWRARQLIAGDDQIGHQIHAKAAELQGHKFDGHGRAQVQAMDYRDQPPTPEPNPPEPQNGQDVKDYLKGLQSGKNTGVKVVPTEGELRRVYDDLTHNSVRVEPDPRFRGGEWRVLPDGTRIGISEFSKSGGGAITVDYGGGRDSTVHITEGARSAFGPESTGGGGAGGGGARAGSGSEGGFRFGGGGGSLEGLPERSSEPGHGLEIYLPDAGPGGGKVGEVDGRHHEE